MCNPCLYLTTAGIGFSHHMTIEGDDLTRVPRSSDLWTSHGGASWVDKKRPNTSSFIRCCCCCCCCALHHWVHTVSGFTQREKNLDCSVDKQRVLYGRVRRYFTNKWSPSSSHPAAAWLNLGQRGWGGGWGPGARALAWSSFSLSARSPLFILTIEKNNDLSTVIDRPLLAAGQHSFTPPPPTSSGSSSLVLQESAEGQADRHHSLVVDMSIPHTQHNMFRL